jgi:hypothetical protein
MFKKPLASIRLEQMARQLRFVRRANGLKTVLVLGSQTGALFRRPALQYLVQALATPEYQAASSYEQFAWCFRQLTRQELFSPAEQQALLQGALVPVAPSEADYCLAQLIIQGYFDPIITANVDSLLEQALTKAGWQQFTVINLTAGAEEHNLTDERRPACALFKVFGSLISQQYVLSNRYAHIGRILQYRALTQILQRDCLVIGFDQTWDEALHYLFPPQGDTCWLIAEEASEGFYALKETRNVLLLHEKDCVDYEIFFGRLYNMLIEQSFVDKTIDTDRPTLPAAPDPPIKRQLQQNALEVFISYHESDEAYLYKLVDHLTNLKRAGLINDWFKSKIQPGQTVAEVTQQHLAKSNIFLLLISPSFIASDTLYLETQQMMQRHKAKQALVIPILLRPADWENTPFGALAPLPSNRSFVTVWRNQDSAFLNIAQGLRKAITEYQPQGN